MPGLRPSSCGVDPATENIKDANDDDDFSAILAARAKCRRMETTVTKPTAWSNTVLPDGLKQQCTLDEQNSKDKVVITKDEVVIIEDVIVEDVVIAKDEVVIVKDEAKDVSHTDDDVAPVDCPVITTEETLQRAIDDEDRESVLTDIDSPKNTDARNDELVDCVLPDTGWTKAKRGRKTGAKGKVSAQAELTMTKDMSHTDIDMASIDKPVLSEVGRTKAKKRGRNTDSVLSKAGETKVKKGRKAGTSGMKKR